MAIRQRVKALQGWSTRILQLVLHPLKVLMRQILRGLFRISITRHHERGGMSGFVLPTTILLLLVLSLAVGSISLRTISRTQQVAGERQQRVIYNAATPAIDRAKAKIAYLIERHEKNTPGIPPEDELVKMMINDDVRFPGFEDQSFDQNDQPFADIYTFNSENNADIIDPEKRIDLDGDGLLDNAWVFKSDTDGDDKPDAWIAYSILFQTPDTEPDTEDNPGLDTIDALRNVKDEAVFERASNLEVRNGPRSLLGSGDRCPAVQQGSVEEGWFSDESNTVFLRKNFQINAIVIPGLTDEEGNLLGPNPTATASTLEMQQDRTFDVGNKWGAWFQNDLEVFSGPNFNWNGAMRTQGSLIVGQDKSFEGYLISSKYSCFNIDRSASEIRVGENIIAGFVDPSAEANNSEAEFHVFTAFGDDPLGENGAITVNDDGADGDTVDFGDPSDIGDVLLIDPVKQILKGRKLLPGEGVDDNPLRGDPDGQPTITINEWDDANAIADRITVASAREDAPVNYGDTYRHDHRPGPVPIAGEDAPEAQGDWEDLAHKEGMRVIVGQRLELGLPNARPADESIANAGADWDSFWSDGSCQEANNTDGAAPERCNEARQRVTLADKLAAVQATAVYRANVKNRPFQNDENTPLACLATTVHPGTAATLARAATFYDLNNGDFGGGLDIDGWVRRTVGGPDGATFNPANWSINPGALLGAENNAAAGNAFPIPAVYIVESDNSTEISEGGETDTYDVFLNTRPTATVVVTITPDAQTDLGSGAGQAILLAFTPDNFNQPQTVTVSAFDDDDPDNNDARIISHSASSNDEDYDSTQNTSLIVNFDNVDSDPTSVVPVTVSDAGVTITESEGITSVSESNSLTDSYEITLDSIPEDAVTITVTPGEDTDVGEGPGVSLALVFDPSADDFSLTQTVTVQAVPDDAVEGTEVNIIQHSVASNDADYDGLVIEPVRVTVLETGITITPLSTNPLPEGGTATYSVVLSSTPTAPVTVTINPESQTSVSNGDANPEPGIGFDLTFDPEAPDFSLSQTITVEAVRDTRLEPGDTSPITHTSESDDANFDELTLPDLVVNIIDAGISIQGVSTDAVPEGGSTTYSVVLNTTPTDPVDVTIVPPDDQTDLGNGAGENLVLTFDPSADDFELTQVVNVTLLNDAQPEGDHTSVLTHTSESADPSYDDLDIADAVINISDPGISIIQTGGITTVSETGVTDQYSIVLNSVPTGAVTVTATPDDQTDLGNGPGVARDFVFGPGALSQTVTVTADPDGIEEGTHSSEITHTVSASEAPEYPVDPVSFSAVNATIIDCFLTGTRLLTDTGEKLVEELQIGDRLQTLDGHLEPIKWVGIQTCYTDGRNHPLRAYPIRVKAGALGPNCPVRDLYVSPDHALLVEGILVNAGALENGDSIVQIEPQGESFVYYHIELERHSVLIADGAPAESYLPQKQDRNTFDNGEEYAERYPHSNMQALMPMKYPRVSSKRQLPRFIQKRIAQQASRSVAVS